MSALFQKKKSLGQHFLKSDAVPKRMCDAADVQKGDIVLEVGPGTGVLTKEILARGATVIALEADERAITALENTFAKAIAEGNLILSHSDVRTLNLSTIPNIRDHEFKVVANIPYYLTGMLFRTFLESAVQPTTLVFLVQKEVARRISANHAKGQKESLLSLSAQVYGDVSYVHTISKTYFSPKPKVDSAIVCIRNIHRDHFAKLPESLFFKVLHIGFGQKRKQLLGNLAKHYKREALTHIFSTLGLSVSVRAEDVPLRVWLDLVRALESTS